ncbi:hypothetical protein [Proteus columbae]|uniref:hypothetical protein n=1 Tax=Proteus columbae TaxID=1987580 RepID=UPI00288AEE3C|nr:hypothetical protein [Proteus columbae]
MHTLFNEPTEIQYGKFLTPRSDRLVKIAKANHQRSVEYYRNRTLTIYKQHVLVTLLNNTPMLKPEFILSQLSIDDVEKYYITISENSNRFGNAVGLTTDNNKGANFSRQFYGKGVDEFIYLRKTPWSEDHYFNWEDLEPVKVHMHPFNVPTYIQLGDAGRLGDFGTAVFSIDIGLLMLQFTMWFKRECEGDVEPKIGIDTIRRFVVQYPMTNLLKSHNDIAIINRAIDYYENDGVVDSTPYVRTPFWLDEQEVHQMDMVFSYLIPELRRTPRYFEDVLNHLPTVWRDGRSTIALPSELDHRQSRWVKVIARMEIISFLLDLNNSFKGPNKNGIAINRIKRSMQNIKQDNLFGFVNPPEQTKLFIKAEYSNIKRLLL